MKRYIYILLLLPIGLLWMCEAEERGQIPMDTIPPGQVTSVSVENLPGGAIVSYIIPEDEDLLYVKAIYRLDDGRIMEQKASAYSTALEIVGIGKGNPQTIQLITGDRSKNESAPLDVEIYPLDSPIYDILKSINIMNDFGGITLQWENPLEADIIISIDTLDMDNKYHTTETIYTSSIVGKGSIRGLPPVERIFAVSITDPWNNTTDTISGLFLPIYEEQLDRTRFSRWNPPGIPYMSLGGGWEIEKIWDGLGGNTGLGFSWPTTSKMGDSWTMNLGVTAKLSRFKIHQRMTSAQVYTGANIKSFDLYGSPHPNVNENEETWIYLGSYESFKPSGLPHGQVSDEDNAYALAGEEYMVDISMPPVRYLRFKINKTWGGANYMQLMEVEFFGQPKEN
ncbi:MAG: DUF5000 domain-containing lipoprotein [Tissierellia bacterium]|nr:DUF5000 domain-containing lipoprotein [Fermentimonas sp.]MDD4437533.1 DUF5000 domain-containing lipoprotein [Tissierellia bacterium]